MTLPAIYPFFFLFRHEFLIFSLYKFFFLSLLIYIFSVHFPLSFFFHTSSGVLSFCLSFPNFICFSMPFYISFFLHTFSVFLYFSMPFSNFFLFCKAFSDFFLFPAHILIFFLFFLPFSFHAFPNLFFFHLFF